MLWLLPVAGAVLVGGVVLLAATASAKRKVTPDGKGKAMPVAKEKRRRQLRSGLGTAALPTDWFRFFEVVAKHESAFNPRAHNGRDSEVAASKRLNERVGTVGGVDFDSPEWTYGSKGLFQFLGANIAVRKGKLRFGRSLTEPDMGYDPGIAIASALDYARGLMGWKQFQGTWASLWVGWGWPAKMHDPAKIAKSANSLHKLGAELGFPEGWANEQVPKLPFRGQSALVSLAKAAAFAYRGTS